MINFRHKHCVAILAVLSTGASAQIGPYVYGTNGTGDYIDAPNPSSGFQLAGPSLGGTATIFGQADFGVAKASAYGSGPTFTAIMFSGWRDTLTVSNAALTGQQGWLTVNVPYRWALSDGVSGSGFAGASGDFYFGSFYRSIVEAKRRSCTVACVDSDVAPSIYTSAGGAGVYLGLATPGSVNYTVPVVFGTSNAIQMEPDATVDAQKPGFPVANAFADGTHSLYWGGITRVTDASGVDVTYSLSSGSGTDYRTSFVSAVPEPAAFILLAAGLLGTAALGSRRQRRRVDALPMASAGA